MCRRNTRSRRLGHSCRHAAITSKTVVSTFLPYFLPCTVFSMQNHRGLNTIPLPAFPVSLVRRIIWCHVWCHQPLESERVWEPKHIQCTSPGRRSGSPLGISGFVCPGKKLSPHLIGPFIIREQVNHNTYWLQLHLQYRITSKSLLFSSTSAESVKADVPPPLLLLEDSPVYSVQDFLDSQSQGVVLSTS